MTVYHQRSCSMQPIIMIPDDNMSGIIAGIQHAPKICVDYLSHEWTKEDDIWTSWKVMSKQKKEMANGIRLENASWRTWAKQKYNLKTVNPKDLNWLKDSDVTWLYGPLHTAWSESPKLQNNTEDKLHLMPSAKSKSKSCLKKKKSMTEILRPIVRGRYGSLVASNSDTQLYKRERREIKESREREIDLDLSDCETASTCSSISGPTTPTTGPTKSILLPVEENVSNTNRKIQFNDRVEQCIAVESDDDTEDLNDSDSSDDGGIVLNKNKRRKDLSTICKLAPTKLKEDRIHNNEYSSLYSNYGKRRQNNQSSSSPSTSSSLPSTEAPSSSSSKPWMMDEDDDELFMDSVMDFDDTLCYDNNNPSSSLSDTSNENNNDEDLGENQNDDYDEINGISDIVRGFIRSIF